jgi:hypothetical protein
VKTLRVAATLAALIVAVSAARAGVTDLGNALGASGEYTTRAYYESWLGQPMTADQQAYADQEDQLRQLGFQAELGGDFASGQMYYQMAYGLTPGSPSAGLSWLGSLGQFGSLGQLGALGPRSLAWRDGGSSGGSNGSSDDRSFSGSYDSSVFAYLAGGSGATLTLNDPPLVWGIAAPEPSTWAMLLIGFAGLAYAGWRGRARPAIT